MFSFLKLKLFGIKPKNLNPIKPLGIKKTIVPKIYIDDKLESKAIWDSHLFQNKIYL